jgi:hypothetical protein
MAKVGSNAVPDKVIELMWIWLALLQLPQRNKCGKCFFVCQYHTVLSLLLHCVCKYMLLP